MVPSMGDVGLDLSGKTGQYIGCQLFQTVDVILVEPLQHEALNTGFGIAPQLFNQGWPSADQHPGGAQAFGTVFDAPTSGRCLDFAV